MRASVPGAILKTKKVISATPTGQIVCVVATDRGSVLDFRAFSTQTGNELLESSEVGVRLHRRHQEVVDIRNRTRFLSKTTVTTRYHGLSASRRLCADAPAIWSTLSCTSHRQYCVQ